MKILENEFRVEFDRWEDPGVYPSGAGGYPLPSYDYVCDVPGHILIEIEPGDLDPDVDAEEQYQEMAAENADIPSGIRVTEWAWSYPDTNKISLSVQNFDGGGYKKDHDEDRYEDDDY